MRDDLQLRLVKVLGEVSHPELPAASDREGAADFLCPDCQRYFSWGVARLEEETCGLRCAECAEAAIRRTPMQRAWTMARMPAFWISAMTVLGALFFISGIGRPSLEGMARRDRKRDWQQKRVPAYYLDQAGRSRKVVEIMARDGKSKELKRWAELCGKAYVQAADGWRGHPPEPYLRLAAGVMMGYAGEPAAGLQAVQALAGSFPAGSRCEATYLFYRGRLELEAGQAAAGQQDLEHVLELTRGDRNAMIDLSIFDDLANSGGNLTSGISENKVIDKSAAKLPPGYLAKESIMTLKHHGINSLIANTVERQIKKEGGWNESAQDLIIEVGE